MIKLFKKKIDSCLQCPNYEEHIFECGGGEQDWCFLSKKEIHPFDKIPSWCNLEDYKED